MSHGNWSGDRLRMMVDPDAEPRGQVREYLAGVAAASRDVGRELRPALAKALVRLALRIDPKASRFGRKIR